MPAGRLTVTTIFLLGCIASFPSRAVIAAPPMRMPEFQSPAGHARGPAVLNPGQLGRADLDDKTTVAEGKSKDLAALLAPALTLDDASAKGSDAPAVPGDRLPANEAHEAADPMQADEGEAEEAASASADDVNVSEIPDASASDIPDADGTDDEASADAADAADQATQQPELPPLSPEMTALRERLRRAVGHCYRHQLSTRNNTPTDVIHLCMAFGCDAQLREEKGNSVNGITCLCWNYPCAGYTLLRTVAGQFAARIGYAMQGHRSQFLAVLALSRVPDDYPIRVGEEVGTIADLVEFEKLECHATDNLSMKLIGLAYYVGTEPSWNNRLGEPWSVARMVELELDRPLEGLPCGGLHRLLGLSFAVDRRRAENLPVDGIFARADDYLARFRDYALTLQNGDGTWNPRYFDYRGSGGSLTEQLVSTGHILQWLVSGLPEEDLQDPRVLKALDFVIRALGERSFRWNLSTASPQEVAAVMHATHALVIYDQRVFQPYDVAEEAEAETEPGGESQP